jgi:hypothetical protein
MLRKKLELKMDDLRLLRARLVPTWCRSLTAKARAREKRSSHSLPLLSRKEVQGRLRLFCVWIYRLLGKEVPTP